MHGLLPPIVRGTVHLRLMSVSLRLFILLVRIHTTGSMPPGCVGGVYMHRQVNLRGASPGA